MVVGDDIAVLRDDESAAGGCRRRNLTEHIGGCAFICDGHHGVDILFIHVLGHHGGGGRIGGHLYDRAADVVVFLGGFRLFLRLRFCLHGTGLLIFGFLHCSGCRGCAATQRHAHRRAAAKAADQRAHQRQRNDAPAAGFLFRFGSPHVIIVSTGGIRVAVGSRALVSLPGIGIGIGVLAGAGLAAGDLAAAHAIGALLRVITASPVGFLTGLPAVHSVVLVFCTHI